MSTIRERVLAVMSAEPDRMYTPEDLIDRLGVNEQSVRKIIYRMTKSGELAHPANGWYCLPGAVATAIPHRARTQRERIVKLETRLATLERTFARMQKELFFLQETVAAAGRGYRPSPVTP